MRRLCARVAIAGLLPLGACADLGTLARLETAKADFYPRVRNARMGVQYDLIRAAELSPGERQRAEARAAAAFMPACVKPYTEKLIARVKSATEASQATHSVSALDPLPSQAAALDIEFDRCVAKFGVAGYNFFETADGQELRVPEYLAWVTAPLREYENASADAAEEKQRNSALVLATLAAVAAASGQVNPDQIRVRQYTRHDGTVVSSHMRTVPNDTCLDNIRGCPPPLRFTDTEN